MAASETTVGYRPRNARKQSYFLKYVDEKRDVLLPSKPSQVVGTCIFVNLDCLARFDRRRRHRPRRRHPVGVVCAFHATFTGWVSRIMNLTRDERKVLMRTI